MAAQLPCDLSLGRSCQQWWKEETWKALTPAFRLFKPATRAQLLCALHIALGATHKCKVLSFALGEGKLLSALCCLSESCAALLQLAGPLMGSKCVAMMSESSTRPKRASSLSVFSVMLKLAVFRSGPACQFLELFLLCLLSHELLPQIPSDLFFHLELLLCSSSVHGRIDKQGDPLQMD